MFKGIVFQLFVASLLIPRLHAADESPLPIADLRVEVILDDATLAFPDPIYGVIRVTNRSPHSAFMPCKLSATLTFDVGGIKSDIKFSAMSPLYLSYMPSGYSFVVPFRKTIANRKQMEAILRGNSTVSVTLSMQAYPEKKSMSKQEIEIALRDGIKAGNDSLVASSVSVKFDLDRSVFRKDADEAIIRKAFDADQWPLDNPFDQEPLASKYTQLDELHYPYSSLYQLRTRTYYWLHDIPVSWLFPEIESHLQAVIDCRTATWRMFEIWRIERNVLLMPQTPENLLRAGEDMVKVFKCMGKAESYFLLPYFQSIPDKEVFVNINGKPVLCHNITQEHLYAEVPFLSTFMPSNLEEILFQKNTAHPMFRDVPVEKREKWRPEYNDLSQPSPRETTLKRWKDNGGIGTPPCSCGIVE